MDKKKDTENYFNLQLLLKQSNELIRNLFIQNYEIKQNDKWIENGKSAKFFFETKNGQVALNMMSDTQKKYALHCDTSKWDLSLLLLILSNTKLIDKSRLNHIEKIKKVNNEIVHNSKFSLNDQEYQAYWSQVLQCLIDLGISKNEIDTCLSNLKNNNDDQFNQSSNMDQIQDLKFKADKHFNQNNFWQAIELYTKAIDFDNMPNNLKSKLYSNRSLAYLKIFEETLRKDRDFLFNSLIDAEQSINFNPKWFKTYARLAQVYVELNEQEKAIENFSRALALNPSNEEIKTMLAKSKFLKFEQNRDCHLDDSTHPKSTEERLKELSNNLDKRFGKKTSKKLIKNRNKIKKKAIKFDKSLKDVFLGHEYRDGSKDCKQNYEMAAKLYSKAVKCGNVEAMYNLASLTLAGKGVKQNFQTALSLLENAAGRSAFKNIYKYLKIPVVGVAESQHLLGIIYQEGIYLAKNIALAIHYYEMAVNNGFAGSANNLGILYFNGDGVDQDIERAESLFLFSHKKGCDDSISNLVDLYLTKGDSTNAQVWHNRAIENNSLYDICRNDKVIEEIKKINESKNILAEIWNLSKSYILKSYSRIFDSVELSEYADKGSTLAQRMLQAMIIFYYAIDDYKKNRNKNNFQFSSFVKKMSQAYQIENSVCQISIELKDELIDRLKSILDLNLKDELNLNASICYMFLIVNNNQQTIEFIDEALKKYPNCLQMHFIKGNMFCSLKKYDQGLKEFDYLIEMDPENCGTYFFLKASALRNLEKFNEAIKIYEIFIQNCPKDARYLPDAYYSIGFCKLNQLSSSQKKNLKNKIILEYIDKGRQAEKDQLPCFLPYQSVTREILIEENFDYNWREVIKNDRELNFQNDYYRTELIKSYRQSFSDIQKFNKSPFKFKKKKKTITPNKALKKSFSLEGLNEISLKQIDFTKDEILEKFFINLRVFDYPLFGFNSVFFLIQDQNGSMERLSVYNLGDDYDKIRQDFKIGTWLSIVNPYIRQAADGKPMIRVDNVDTIIFTGEFTNNMCQYCGNANSKFSCSKCMKALYCSKQCQINDWKHLNHKLVCT